MDSMETVVASLNSEVSAIVSTLTALVVRYTFSVLGAIILLVVGFVLAGLVRKWIYKALSSTRRSDETLAKFLSKVARYAVLAVVIVMVLSQFGVQTASIIAALGAAGLAIGLALQGTLQNVAAGLVLLFLRPFKVGDYIDCGSVSGVVVEIGLFATEFKTVDGLYVLAPNASVWGTPVTNYNRHDVRRFDFAIGIGYDEDIDLAMATMRDIIGKDGRVLSDPEPYIFVDSLGDSAVGVTCRIWTRTPDWWTTTRDLVKAGKEAFDAKGISIPYPQRDVHLHRVGRDG